MDWLVPRFLDSFEPEPLERTEVRLFQPYDGVKPSDRLTLIRGPAARCFKDLSIADFRNPNAHRCFAANDILDPCFSLVGIRRDDDVICMEAPWLDVGRLVRVTETMETPSNPRIRLTRKQREALRQKAPPWALQLANGERCLYATGATLVMIGGRINYFCLPGTSRPTPENTNGVIVGELDRSEPVWRVQFAFDGETEIRQVGVRAAWY